MNKLMKYLALAILLIVVGASPVAAQGGENDGAGRIRRHLHAAFGRDTTRGPGRLRRRSDDRRRGRGSRQRGRLRRSRGGSRPDLRRSRCVWCHRASVEQRGGVRRRGRLRPDHPRAGGRRARHDGGRLPVQVWRAGVLSPPRVRALRLGRWRCAVRAAGAPRPGDAHRADADHGSSRDGDRRPGYRLPAGTDTAGWGGSTAIVRPELWDGLLHARADPAGYDHPGGNHRGHICPAVPVRGVGGCPALWLGRCGG